MTTIARPRAGEVPPPRVAAYASSQGSVDAFARDSIAVPLHFPGQPRRPGPGYTKPPRQGQQAYHDTEESCAVGATVFITRTSVRVY